MLFLAAEFLLLLLFPKTLFFIEYSILGFMAFALLSALAEVLLGKQVGSHDHSAALNDLLYWFPFFYLLAFLIFKDLRRFLAAGGIFLAVVLGIQLLHGVSEWRAHGEIENLVTIGRFFVANVSYIILLSFSGHLYNNLVSARKYLEEDLEGKEILFQTIFERSLDGVVISDALGKPINLNPTTAHILGYTTEELLKQPGLGTPHPDEVETRKRLLQGLLSHPGQAFPLKLRRQHRDGTWRWLEGHAINLLDVSGVNGLVTNIRDITERILVESQLQASEVRYRQLAEAAHDLVAVIDRDFKVVYHNSVAAQLWGSAARDLNGKKLDELFPAQVASSQKATLQKVQESGEALYVEAPSIFQGKEIWLGTWLTPLGEIQRGEKSQVLVVARDISRTKVVEQSLLKTQQQLRALSHRTLIAIEAERAQIARDLHDDFGQSLTAIKIDLSRLAAALPKNEAVMGLLKETNSLVDSGIEQVRQIATGLRPAILDDLGLSAALDWLAAGFKQRTGIACELDLPEQSLPISSDLNTAIFRIAQEALTNVARHAQASQVLIRLKQEGEAVSLIIQDNGRGITPQEIENPLSLGLLGMRERLYPWEGGLKVEAEPGQGTTIRISVPLPVLNAAGGSE